MSNINARIQYVLSLEFKPSVILTIGNSFRCDDGVGPYIGEKLTSTKSVLVVNAEYSPECVIDEIVAFGPKSIVIIDAADFGGLPGEIRLIKAENLAQATLSTHSIPLSVISQILINDTRAKVEFVGIQVKHVSMGGNLSQEVKDAADKIVKLFYFKSYLSSR